MHEENFLNKRKKSKNRAGIYLLPNLFTTAALFAGFYSIVSAIHSDFESAAIAIFIAIVLDGMDGRVARITRTQSAFGAEYDSLSDMVSFGLAPALVIYEWSLYSMKSMGFPWNKIAWLATFFYVASAALRLARFSTQTGKQDKRWFRGLPSPAAAAVVMGLVWSMHDMGFSGEQLPFVALTITVIAAVLMISNISYYGFKNIDFSNRVSFVAMPIVVLIFVFATIDPSKVLYTGFVFYALSGIVLSIIRRRKKIVISSTVKK